MVIIAIISMELVFSLGTISIGLIFSLGTISLVSAQTVTPNEKLDCEICGGSSGTACFGPGAPAVNIPTESDVSPPSLPSKECEDFQYCRKLFNVLRPEFPNASEIIERSACIDNPPHVGCKLTPYNSTHNGTLDCYCNEMLGSFMKFPVPPPIKVTVEDGGFCNGRLSCYQCFDCLLPENPAFCIRPNTSLEMELHLGRISFCTVEVREGVVRRGCGFDPVEFPEVWWPDCTFTNWDHLNSQCKCYGQMCNDKFFYRNLNLGDEIIGKLSKFLPTPRSIPTTLTNPPEGVILCHLCDIEAKGALAESCYRPPTKDDIQNKNRTVISCDTSAGESCFKEYKFSPTNTSKIFQAYRIQKKGCRQANETGFKPLTRFEAERGCVLNSGPGGTISCNCVSNLCNVYTKCHQCFGSLGKCDSTRIDYRIPGTDCVNEFLRPRERLSTSSRNEIGVAHMCSMLLSEQVVSRVCTPIMDFGTGLGSLYFLTEQPATFELPWYVPAPCNRWGKGGFERWDWSYFECTCWAHGCNSREILGVRGRTDSKKVQRELNAPPKKSKYSAQPF